MLDKNKFIVTKILWLLCGLQSVKCFIQPAVTVNRQWNTVHNNKQYIDQSTELTGNVRLQKRQTQHLLLLKATLVLDSEVRVREIINNDDTNDDDDDDNIATIQILMSDTGGGHRASANALRDAFDLLYPGQIQCDIVDIYTEYGPVWPYNDYVAMYKLLAKYPWTWDLFYKFGCTKIGLALNEFLLETFCFTAFTECLARPQPSTGKRADMVLSVHPLTQDVPLKILAHLDSAGKSKSYTARTKTPFVTVVTDLGSAHPTWFNPNVDKCFVPSTALYQCAIDRGLSNKQIIQHGLPIRKGFWNTSGRTATTIVDTSEKKLLRNKLGIQSNLPTVLIVGGGDGMGGLVDISKALGDQLGSNSMADRYQMIVVCGNNVNAKHTLEQHKWPTSVNVVVQGFVNNMDEWMKASDALVTKAGPGTIAEASICGLPCMMFSYLPGQEEGNIPFVENSGFGQYSADPIEIGKVVSSWLASPDKLQQLQQSALVASRPSATLDIAQDIAQMVLQKKKKKIQSPTKVVPQVYSML